MAESKYNEEEILAKTKHYIENFKEYGDKMPMIEALAVELGISQRLIYFWEHDERKKKFAELLDTLRATQARICLNLGLSGDFQSTISKLVLHNHGYSEKSENTNKYVGDQDNPIVVRSSDEILIEQALKRLGERKNAINNGNSKNKKS